jgi:hypothetical protein
VHHIFTCSAVNIPQQCQCNNAIRQFSHIAEGFIMLETDSLIQSTERQ